MSLGSRVFSLSQSLCCCVVVFVCWEASLMQRGSGTGLVKREGYGYYSNRNWIILRQRRGGACVRGRGLPLETNVLNERMEGGRTKKITTERGGWGKTTGNTSRPMSSTFVFNSHFKYFLCSSFVRRYGQVSWWMQHNIHKKLCRSIRFQHGHLPPSSGPRWTT